MTREHLEYEANRLIAAAKATVELQGEFSFTILVHISDKWRHLPFPAECGSLMNSGSAKDAIFGAVREIVKRNGIDAVIFGSDAWGATITPEGEKHLDTPEWRELQDFGFVKLAQRGWVVRSETFIITAQNATEALLINQKYQRLASGMIQLLGSRREWFDQGNFEGRQKMFGDLRFENLGSEAATKGGA